MSEPASHSIDTIKPPVASLAPSASASVSPASAAGAAANSALRSAGVLGSMFSRLWQIDAAGVVLLAVFTGAAYLVAVAPTLERREANEALRGALVDAKSRVASLAAQARLTRAQLATVQSTLSRVEIPLQPAATVNSRMAALTDLAAQCGLDVQFTQTGAPASASQRFGRVPIQISGSGTYSACTMFLARLRNDSPDTGVRMFDLSVVPGDAAAKVAFNFNLTWYVKGK